MSDAVDRFLEQREPLLVRLDAELASAASASDVAWTLCEFAGRELDLDDCVVYLPEPDGTLLQQAAWGPKRAAEHMLESRIRLASGRGVVGDCAQRLQTQRVDDTRGDPRYVADDVINLSELAIPLQHDGAVLGVLDSEHPDPGWYDTRHEQALAAIAERGTTRLRQLRG